MKYLHELKHKSYLHYNYQQAGCIHTTSSSSRAKIIMNSAQGNCPAKILEAFPIFAFEKEGGY